MYREQDQEHTGSKGQDPILGRDPGYVIPPPSAQLQLLIRKNREKNLTVNALFREIFSFKKFKVSTKMMGIKP
jgi:hypothetical protein